MGRWVTRNGKHIYIPDEGEENPYSKENKAARSNTPASKRNALAQETYGKNYEDLSESKQRAINRYFQDEETINKDVDLSKDGTYKLNGQTVPEDLPRVSDEDARHNKMVDYKGTKYSTQQVVDYNKEKGGEYVAGHMYVPHDDLSKGSFFVSKDGEMYHSGSDYLNAESRKKMNAQINKDFDTKEKQIAENKKQIDKNSYLRSKEAQVEMRAKQAEKVNQFREDLKKSKSSLAKKSDGKSFKIAQPGGGYKSIDSAKIVEESTSGINGAKMYKVEYTEGTGKRARTVQRWVKASDIDSQKGMKQREDRKKLSNNSYTQAAMKALGYDKMSWSDLTDSQKYNVSNEAYKMEERNKKKKKK